MTTVADAGRPSRLPRGERRVMLLQAAREAFVALGYHGAGMDAIADLAGVSKPVLYQHFPGKLELYVAVLDESTESLVAAVRTALGSTHDNARRVQATIEAYFAFVADDSAAFKLVFESDLTNEPEVGRRVNRANEKCAEMISAVIAEDTGLGTEESMILATGMTGMAQTAARRWLASGSRISQKAAARDLYWLAWRGISGFPLTHPASTAEAVRDRQAADQSQPQAESTGSLEPATQPEAADEGAAAATGTPVTTRPQRTTPAKPSAPPSRRTSSAGAQHPSPSRTTDR